MHFVHLLFSVLRPSPQQLKVRVVLRGQRRMELKGRQGCVRQSRPLSLGAWQVFGVRGRREAQVITIAPFVLLAYVIFF